MNYTEKRPWGLFENLLERDDCKEELIKISGHYVFSHERLLGDIYDVSFETIIKEKLRKKIGELNDIL